MSTESDTTTEEGEIQIQYSLIHARKENVERLTHTIPDLKRFVKSGNFLEDKTYLNKKPLKIK